MDIRFEIAESTDFELIYTTMRSAFETISMEYLGHAQAVPPIIHEPEKVQTRINEGRITKIMVGDHLAGGYITNHSDTMESWLDIIWVSPDYQGKGIGKHTWYHIENSHPNVKKWLLDTPSFAKGNIEFYKQLGFVEVRRDSYEGIELIVFEKSLL